MKAKTWLRGMVRKDGVLVAPAVDMGYAQSLKGCGMLSQRASKGVVTSTFSLTGKGSLWLKGLSKLA